MTQGLKFLKYMLEALFRVDVPNRRVSRVISSRACEPWSEVGGFYVGWFENQLEYVARGISQDQGRSIKARFNRLLMCAELHTPDGEVIAQVSVFGDCDGLPTEVNVESSSPLPETTQVLFREAFRGPPVKFDGTFG